MLLHFNKTSINSEFIKTRPVEILEENYWVTTTILVKVNGSKHPLCSESDRAAGMLLCSRPNNSNLKRPRVVLGSPKWEVLCLGNQSTCFQETASAQLPWYPFYSPPLNSSVPASHRGLPPCTEGSSLNITAANPCSHRHRGPSRHRPPTSPHSTEGGL